MIAALGQLDRLRLLITKKVWTLVLAISLCQVPEGNAQAAEPLQLPLELGEVLASVTGKYPPYLAALIERDIANGKLRNAIGALDLQTYFRVFTQPSGFYQATTTELGFEQPTTAWGATIFGGYRRTDGFLPDYYNKRRTNEDGTPILGLKVPLLRNGRIDPKRAKIQKAELDKLLADPVIQRQHLDMTLSAMKAYFGWLAAGKKLQIKRAMLEVAKQRAAAVKTQIEQGISAPIADVENRQLIASRELDAVKARQEYEAAAIALSLFYRDANDETIYVSPGRLPEFPQPKAPGEEILSAAMQYASSTRPEVRIYELELQKLNVDTRLFRNQLQPQLDTYVSASRSLGDELYKDKGELEVELGVEFRVPLQRNQAKGALEVNRGKIEKLQLSAEFAVDKIAAEVWKAYVKVQAAWEQIGLSKTNVDLARQLHQVEQDKFRLGAADFIALQIREGAAIKAQITEIESIAKYYDALSQLLVATATDLREDSLRTDQHLMDLLSDTVKPPTHSAARSQPDN